MQRKPRSSTSDMRHTRGGGGAGGEISDLLSTLIFDLGIKENGK